MHLSRDAVNRLVLKKHHLTRDARVQEAMAIVRDLVGLHATDPNSPYLQLWARMRSFDPGELDVLLDEGRAARLQCMRSTLFIEAADAVPLVLAATRRRLLARERDRYLAANGLTPARYEALADRVIEVVAGRELDARQIRAELATSEALPAVLVVMCDEARLVRWRGRGGWRSASCAYRVFAEALPGVDLSTWEEPDAIRELVRRYVCTYGPVGERDIRWWTGLDAASVGAAVAALDSETVRVTIDGVDGTFLLHRDDLEVLSDKAPSADPEVAVLPMLDPYLQGYKDRARVVDAAHRDYVTDRGGNSTSVVLVDGLVAGVWDLVRRPRAEARVLLLAAVDREVRDRALATAAGAGALLLGQPVPAVEVHEMEPLTQGAAWVRSPLTTPAERARP